MATKKLSLPAGRSAYTPSGLVKWSVFLPGVLVTLCVAGLMAYALAYLSLAANFRLLVIGPILAVAVAGLVMYQTIRLGHCRNPIVAVLFGIAVGTVVGLGEYQAEIAILVGPGAITRLDLLPDWIYVKMNTQVIKKVAAADRNGVNGPGDVGIAFNWFFLCLEVGMCVVGCAVVARIRARAVYDEVGKTWAVGEKLILPEGAGAKLAHALADNSIGGLIDALGRENVESVFSADENKPLVRRMAIPKTDGFTSLEFYRVDAIDDGGQESQRFYLTIKENSPKNKQGQRVAKAIIEQWELTIQEAALFAAYLRETQRR